MIRTKRWIGERTFVRLSAARLFSRDDERLPQTTETMFYIRRTCLMSRRPAKLKLSI